jgi:hypothetical protein
MSLKVGLSIVLAVLTYNLIERPARSFLGHASRQKIAYAFFSAMLALCIPLGLIIASSLLGVGDVTGAA